MRASCNKSKGACGCTIESGCGIGRLTIVSESRREQKSDLEAEKAAAEKKREETLKQLAAEEALAAEAKIQAQAEAKKNSGTSEKTSSR